jgi:hypothetical protein
MSGDVEEYGKCLVYEQIEQMHQERYASPTTWGAFCDALIGGVHQSTLGVESWPILVLPNPIISPQNPIAWTMDPG